MLTPCCGHTVPSASVCRDGHVLCSRRVQVHRVGSRVLDTARILLEDELALIAEADENGEAASLFKSDNQAVSMMGASGRRIDGPFAGR